MERKDFLKNGIGSLMGTSALSLLASDFLMRNEHHGPAAPKRIFRDGQADTTDPVFNVYDYGAAGNGKDLDTKAIQAAIDACHRAGGGTVVFPRGYFLTGTLFLKDAVLLEIEVAATVLGSTRLADYNPQHPHLIYAKEVSRAGIVGDGTINGQGEVFWKGKHPPYHRPGSCIRFEKCEQMNIKGITVTNVPQWTISFTQCDRIHIDGISIINDLKAPNTDGIDPVSSRNVFISNCYIDTGDDAICLKANKSGPCERVVVTNCILRSDDTAIKCGTSNHGDIRHCVFDNIVIFDTRYGIGFFMKDDESTFEDIQFSNINIQTVELLNGKPKNGYPYFLHRWFPVFMDIEPRTRQSGLGSIRNIHFKNMIIHTWGGNCLLAGWEGKPIENVSLENIQMKVHARDNFEGRVKPRGTGHFIHEKMPNDYADVLSHFTFANINNLRLNNITVEDISGEQEYPRYEIWGDNLNNADLTGIHYVPAPADQKMPALRLKDCSNVFIRGCRSPLSESAFVILEGEKTADVNIIGNDFFYAKQGVSAKTLKENVVFESANRGPGTG